MSLTEREIIWEMEIKIIEKYYSFLLPQKLLNIAWRRLAAEQNN